jgi:hypothetical protein
MRKALLAIIFIVLAAILFFAVTSNSHRGNAGRNKPAKDKDVVVAKAAPNKDNTFVSWEFETWQPDNRFWNAPSSLTISDDGDWYVFASRLENQLRTGGFFDTGHKYSFDITVNFYPVFNAASGRCEGASLYGFSIHVDTLDYKEVHTNVTVRGKDRHIPEIVARTNCATATRSIG